MSISRWTTSRSARDWLFKGSKPLVRQYQETDNGILWAAYQAKTFDLPDGLSQEQFLVAVAQKFGGFPLLWIVEDEHRGFKAGRGPVGLVGLKTDGWVYEPRVLFFRWAKKRNILRASVSFFHMMRSRKDVGCCLVRVLKKDFSFMKHLEKYGVLYLRGKIPNGSPQGHLFVFSIDGEKA